MLKEPTDPRLIDPFLFASFIAAQVCLSAPIVLSKDPELMVLVPVKACEGSDSWRANGYYIASCPGPVILERLAELCAQTHGNEIATAFRKELSRLCSASTKP